MVELISLQMHRVFLIGNTVNGNFVAENLRSKSAEKINCSLSPRYVSSSSVHANGTA